MASNQPTIDESIVRRELRREAESVAIPPGLADRVIRVSLAEAGQPATGERPMVTPVWRNWLIPVLAAACVAVLIAAALLGRTVFRSSGTADHPNPPATRSLPVGPVHTPSNQPAPTGSPSVSSPPTGSPSATQTKGVPVVAIPAGFTVRDLSFVSLTEGWALGSHACTDVAVDCATSLAHTTDGGRTWSGLPTPPWANGGPVTDIEHLRFATSQVGYAFSSTALYLTTDAGRSWQRQDGGAWGLEVANGIAVRVLGQGACAPGCNFRVERAAVGSSSWQPVSLPPGAFPAGAELVRTGHVLALATYGHPAGGASNAHGALFISTDDGASWRLRTVCPSPATTDGEVDLTSLALAPDGTIAVLCAGRMAGHGGFVQTSTDNGASFATIGSGLGAFQPARVGAASSGVLFVQSDALYREAADTGHNWRRTGPGQGPPSASFIGFQTPTTGRVVQAGDPNAVDPGSQTIWTTTDSGLTWTKFTFH
jgi:photosystem II stability/assembly factor-like uncharacterized protein